MSESAAHMLRDYNAALRRSDSLTVEDALIVFYWCLVAIPLVVLLLLWRSLSSKVLAVVSPRCRK